MHATAAPCFPVVHSRAHEHYERTTSIPRSLVSPDMHCIWCELVISGSIRVRRPTAIHPFEPTCAFDGWRSSRLQNLFRPVVRQAILPSDSWFVTLPGLILGIDPGSYSQSLATKLTTSSTQSSRYTSNICCLNQPAAHRVQG